MNNKLQIESEDELIEMINEIYKKDRKCSPLYANVLFCNVSQEKMKEFVTTISYEDIDEGVWVSLSKRLSSDIVFIKKKEENINDIKIWL